MEEAQENNFSKFYFKTKDSDGSEYLLFGTGITATFFLETPLAETHKAVANLVEYFIAQVPQTNFRSNSGASGYFRALKNLF